MSEVKIIPDGWVETTLGELGKLARGKSKHRPRWAPHLFGGNYPFIQTGQIKSARKYIKTYEQTYSEAGLAQSKLWDKNTLCITIAANIAEIAILEFPACFPDSVLGFKTDENKCDLDFIYYNFTMVQAELRQLAIGSVQDNINLGTFENLQFLLPPLPEQKSIAAILTTFDDKIELLQAQSKTLEETAQTIFAEWYSKYKNGDELPEGWQIDRLEKIANHSKTSIKPFDNPDAEYYHYSLPSYDNGLIPVIEKGEMIKSNKYLVENNSFLVSKLNPFTPRIWTIFDAQQNFICSTEFQVVKPKEELYFSLIHCFLNSDEFTSELSQKIKGTSSSHQRVNPQDIFDVELVIPSENDLINFNSTIYPLLAKKNINHKQIQTLSLTRDKLLPRLMTGEIRINEFKV